MIPTSKHELRFHGDGSFRILMISDIQETLNYDSRTLVGMRLMMDELKPDLVILGGDNVDGRYVKRYDEFRKYMDIFTAPMEERKIPWMHIFGNHDYDVDVSAEEQQKIYEAYPYCISSHSKGISGVSNYMIPIMTHDSGAVAYAVYAFDSKYKDAELRPSVKCKDLLLPVRESSYHKWDSVHFDQQMWYWNLSCELEKKEGHKVRAMAVMHVPPQEIMMTVNNPEETGYKGYTDEKIQSSMLNSGVYSTMLERGDVEIIAAGHIHKNTSDGVFGGIRFTLDACVGFAPKSFDDRRGGRVFDLNEDGTYETYMYTFAEHMDISKKDL